MCTFLLLGIRVLTRRFPHAKLSFLITQLPTRDQKVLVFADIAVLKATDYQYDTLHA